MTLPLPDQVTGVVLAGGRARRMGGRDKGLLSCGGRPLIVYALEALRPLCSQVLINANRSHQAYQHFDQPVIADSMPGFHGPLAGILSAMQAAGTEYLLVSPCDCPRLQSQTLARLLTALVKEEVDIAIAHDGKRLHPVVMALRNRLADDLADWLAAGRHKIDTWAQRHPWRPVDCSEMAEQFININTPEELHTFENDGGQFLYGGQFL